VVEQCVLHHPTVKRGAEDIGGIARTSDWRCKHPAVYAGAKGLLAIMLVMLARLKGQLTIAL
jgi:hypothetical protein